MCHEILHEFTVQPHGVVIGTYEFFCTRAEGNHPLCCRLGLSQLKEELGVCPLMLEESILILVALGFKRATRIYLAGANIQNGKAKMARLKFLYPNLVTKEDLLSVEELQPFHNHSIQVGFILYEPLVLVNLF